MASLRSKPTKSAAIWRMSVQEGGVGQVPERQPDRKPGTRPVLEPREVEDELAAAPAARVLGAGCRGKLLLGQRAALLHPQELAQVLLDVAADRGDAPPRALGRRRGVRQARPLPAVHGGVERLRLGPGQDAVADGQGAEGVDEAEVLGGAGARAVGAVHPDRRGERAHGGPDRG